MDLRTVLVLAGIVCILLAIVRGGIEGNWKIRELANWQSLLIGGFGVILLLIGLFLVGDEATTTANAGDEATTTANDGRPTTTTTVSPPQVEIRTPANGSRVPLEITATGTAKNIPEGARIWLVVKVGNGYFPQIGALTLLQNDEWSQQVLFGGPNDGGKTFMLMAVQADSAAHQRFDRWVRDGRATGNFPAMEEGGEYPAVKPLAAVTLIRS